MSLRYGSVCSGIEAATVAWHPFGWRPQFFSELAEHPRAVLAHRYPEVPLHGDFTTIRADEYGPIQLLVGGTPCQSFSLAGLRGGLADDRGNLALEFLRLAKRLRPRWVVWENVPGVLSSGGGRDLGAILGGLVELGYGFAYRVLDAQYVRIHGFGRAVAQRRRRVFVVGYLGDWRRPAAVLLERASLRGDPAPRRETEARVAGTLAAGSGGGCGPDDNDARAGHLVAGALAGTGPGGGWRIGPDEAAAGQLVAHSLRGEGFDASEDGTGRGTPIIPVAQTLRARDGAKGVDSDCTDTLLPVAFGGNDTRGPIRVAPALTAHGGPTGRLDFESEAFIAFNARQDPDVTWARAGSLSASLPQAEAIAIGHNGGPALEDWDRWAVRRLTPTECERLQGFPDGYTAVPWRRGIMPDGPRYKMLGNSMACNVMRWIGRRIEAVDALETAPVLMAAE